ncbi:uncharacterized protein LOC128955945 [Oppia nitens]|uniref:uncharacterized protein LOC128955945 n=1 Tax=Oppia nitens TaxID=1686743 RepID=UPI0023DB48D3|nr:uncharacterized protein LOC128955945 [Oppia nitens]
MISRRKILYQTGAVGDGQEFSDIYQCDGDVWFSLNKFIEDHILEVLKKWDQIDDEIWAKIICMERNHRVAKAYARSATLQVNGSDQGFSDSHIGLNGFTNARDKRLNYVRQYVRQGIRLKVEQSGDIIIERLNKSSVFVKKFDNLSTTTTTAGITGPNLMVANHQSIALDYQKPVKLFDMKRFRLDVIQELATASYPDRKYLERKCVSSVAFVRDSPHILQTPIWCLVINILALDLLKSRLTTPIKCLQPLRTNKSLSDDVKALSSVGTDHQTVIDSHNKDITYGDLYYMGIKARFANSAKSRASFAFPFELRSRSTNSDDLCTKSKSDEGRYVDIKLDIIGLSH